MNDPIPHAMVSNLGLCCACGGAGPTVRNVMMLDQKCPTPGRGWGCVQCGLPSDGAVAVVCDGCREADAPLKYACAGYPATDGRVAIETLKGRHAHDLRKHPDEVYQTSDN